MPQSRCLNIPEALVTQSVQGGIGVNDILIFGTGDLLGIPTVTGDGRAVGSAAAQGVNFNVIEHQEPRFAGNSIHEAK